MCYWLRLLFFSYSPSYWDWLFHMSERNKTLEQTLYENIKAEAAAHKQAGRNPTHVILHPDTWIAVLRDSLLPVMEKRRGENGVPYTARYRYQEHPSAQYPALSGKLEFHPSEDIEKGAALICDRATASLYVDELLGTEED